MREKRDLRIGMVKIESGVAVRTYRGGPAAMVAEIARGIMQDLLAKIPEEELLGHGRTLRVSVETCKWGLDTEEERNDGKT